LVIAGASVAVNLLLSYAFHQAADLAKVRKDLVCGRLMIDSGAFTAFTTGRKIALDEYAEYLERWRGCWDHAMTLDVIGDPEKTAAQTRKLHMRGLPVMPVFTKGGTLADFDAMVKEHGYIAVGGTVGLGTKHQCARVTMLQRRALALGGGIHALGVGALSTLRVAKPYSADASSVSGAFRFGTVVYFTGRDIRNTPLMNRKRLHEDRDHLRGHGIDLAPLVRSRRLPGQTTGRKELMQAMSLAYACADEVLKGTSVAAPAKLLANGTHLYSSISPHAKEVDWAAGLDRQLHGTHLYNSMTPEFGLDPASGLDRVLHGDSELPGVWRVHGRDHHRWCRAAVAEGVSA
jgi:hypothetical protein